jgi:DNA-binding XRE family transcriptional regulator
MRNRSFVRQIRRQWQLSQEELAGLVNCSQAKLSRCEKGVDPPDLETAISLQLVFGKSIRFLFPDLYERLEEVVMRQAAEFDRCLQGKVGFAADQKRRLLEAMAHRALRAEQA